MRHLAHALTYVGLLLAALIAATPLVWLGLAAFKTSDDIQRYPMLPPVVTHSPVGTAAAAEADAALTILRGVQGRFAFAVDHPANADLLGVIDRLAAAAPRAWVVESGGWIQHRSPRTGVADPEASATQIPQLAVPRAALAVLREDIDAVRTRIQSVAGHEAASERLDLALAALDRSLALAPESLGGTERGTRFTFRNFRSLFGQMNYLRYLMNSLFVTGATVLLQLFFSSLGGFALAKYEFRGRRVIMLIMLATMMIPGPVLLAPLYELVFHMKLMDSHAGLIVPGLVSVFGMFLFRQAMVGVPDELLHAGQVDGCSEFGLYWHVVLPVVRPMTGAFCLIAFMGTWNSFLWPQIILQTSDLYTLPIGLRQMVGLYQEDYGALMAGTLLAILPVVALFFALQREFIAGLTAGSVKG